MVQGNYFGRMTGMLGGGAAAACGVVCQAAHPGARPLSGQNHVVHRHTGPSPVQILKKWI
jgi:hypothetical protein